MKYFVTGDVRAASGSDDYYEFFKGEWESTSGFWSESSLYLSEENVLRLGFATFLKRSVLGFDPGGETLIRPAVWDKLLERAKSQGGELADALTELDPWAKQAFLEKGLFTIFGL